MQEEMKKALGNYESEGDRIDRVYLSIISKFNKTLRVVNEGKGDWRFFLTFDELAPILTKEESEMIGYWKGTLRGGERYINKTFLEKLKTRLVYQFLPDFNKQMRDAGKGKFRI